MLTPPDSLLFSAGSRHRPVDPSAMLLRSPQWRLQSFYAPRGHSATISHQILFPRARGAPVSCGKGIFCRRRVKKKEPHAKERTLSPKQTCAAFARCSINGLQMSLASSILDAGQSRWLSQIHFKENCCLKNNTLERVG
jgi:hypothetical protein